MMGNFDSNFTFFFSDDLVLFEWTYGHITDDTGVQKIHVYV
jgi:hypothetical protein